MDNKGFTRLQCRLVDLTLPNQSYQASSSDPRCSPMRQRHSGREGWVNAQGVTGPCEKCGTLADCPVGFSVKLQDAKGGVWGVGGEEEGERGGGGGFLVDEGYP